MCPISWYAWMWEAKVVVNCMPGLVALFPIHSQNKAIHSGDTASCYVTMLMPCTAVAQSVVAEITG